MSNHVLKYVLLKSFKFSFQKLLTNKITMQTVTSVLQAKSHWAKNTGSIGILPGRCAGYFDTALSNTAMCYFKQPTKSINN